MDELKAKIRDTIETASERKDGDLYASMYEKYAVILMRLQVVEDELKFAKECSDRMWKQVCVNLDSNAENHALGVSNAAEKLAIDAIKLAIDSRRQVK